MTKSHALDFEHYRQRLVALQQQLETDLRRFEQDEQSLEGGPDEPGPGQHWEHFGYGDHMADDATEVFEKEKDIGLEQTLRAHLRQVRHALERLEEGTYGTCEVCGQPIAKERLDAMPEATVCLSCKQREERRPAMAHQYLPRVSS